MFFQHRALLLLLAAASLTFAIGCEDDASGTPSKGPERILQPPDEPEPDPIPEAEIPFDTAPPTDIVVEEAIVRFKLTILGDDALQMNYINEVDLFVEYTDVDGDPVRGADVNFAFEGNPGDSVLSETAVRTNVDGIATTTLTSGITRAAFRIVVTAPRATAVEYDVEVSPKGSAQYIVHSDYTGDTALDSVVVELHESSVTCDSISPLARPTALVAQGATPDAAGLIPDTQFAGLLNGSGYTVVATGVIGADVVAAYGCNDSAPIIRDGFDEEVTVVLDEYLPDIEGTYDIETHVDLVDALPEPLATAINVIGNFFVSPGDGVVYLLFGEPFVEDALVDGDLAIFDNPGFHQIVADAVNDLIGPLISSDLQEVFDIGGALYQTITQFTLRGNLVVDSEPNPSGSLTANNIHRYDRIVINWPVGCGPTDPPNCGENVFAMTDLAGVGFLSGDWTGRLDRIDNQGFLQVDRHSFAFNIGAVVLSLIEQLIFPEIFGPGVDTVREALASIIDCRGIADDVFDPAVPENFLFNSLLFDACNEGIDELEGFIISEVTAIDTDVPNLTIGTFEPRNDADIVNVACPMDEGTYGPGDDRRHYTYLGNETDTCDWDTRLETSNEVRDLRSDFYGEWLP